MKKIYVLLVALFACVTIGAGYEPTGNSVTESTFMSYTTNGIVMEHDILSETDVMSIVADIPGKRQTLRGVQWQHDVHDEWGCSGSGTITRGPDGTYYVITRDRPNDQQRGYQWVCYESTDLQTWNIVWIVNRQQISHAPSFNSLEKVCLRYYNNQYYFYFCMRETTAWKIYFVTASSVEQIQTEILDYNNWNYPNMASYCKDPNVIYENGNYYMYCMRKSGGTKYQSFYKATNPEFTDKQLVWSQRAYAVGVNSCVITFDSSSNKYIMLSLIHI